MKTKILLVVFIFLLVLIRFFWFDISKALYFNHFENKFLNNQVGFTLYLDPNYKNCSQCLTEIIQFEKVKSVYSDTQYSVLIGESDKDIKYFSQWIKSNLIPDFNHPLRIDHNSTFRNHYKLSPGSKVMFFNSRGNLVKIFETQELSLKEYLQLFKNHWD